MLQMGSEQRWICVRQRVGPLVKECRSIRPRLSKYDTAYERAEKNKVLRPPRDSSVCRTRVDRLELRLALFGYEGSVYTLTFDREHEPQRFAGVRKSWRSFLRRMKLWRGRPFDYIYLIEGRHGDHRYHIHLVLRDSDFPPAEVRWLWRFGENVEDQPLLLGPKDTYRRTARYFNKEATDGITIPVGARTWVCSSSLTRQLPPAERWLDASGEINVPEGVRRSGGCSVSNEFGAYRYAWYIEEKKSVC